MSGPFVKTAESVEPISAARFTILLVDDQPKDLDLQMEEIKRHVEKKGLILNLLPNKSGRGIPRILKENNVDILMTDMKLVRNTGQKVVKSVKDSGVWTDVLFYTQQTDVDYDKIREETGHYPFLDFTARDLLVPDLTRMIDKNVRRWSDVVYLRGVFISMMIEVELEINNVLSKYFKVPAKTRASFQDLIMESRDHGLQGKVEALNKILKAEGLTKANYKALKKDLIELQSKRNVLAHCKRHPTKDNCLVSAGEPRPFDKQAIIDLFDLARKSKESLCELKKEVKYKKLGMSTL